MGLSKRYQDSLVNSVTSNVYGVQSLANISDERVMQLIEGTKEAILGHTKFLCNHDFDSVKGDKYRDNIQCQVAKLQKRLKEFETERVRRGL